MVEVVAEEDDTETVSYVEPQTANAIAFYVLAIIVFCWATTFIAGCFRPHGFNFNHLVLTLFFSGLLYMAARSYFADRAEAAKKKKPTYYPAAQCLDVADRMRQLVAKYK